MLGRLSLQERLVVLMAAAVLPLSVLSVWFSWRDVDAGAMQAQEQLKFAASLIAAHQDRTVEGAQQLLGAISAMPQMRSPERSSCEKYFEALRVGNPSYANIGILDFQGQVICHANGRIGDFSAADRAYFIQAVAQRRFVMGAPVVGRTSGRLVIPFAQPVFDGERISGVVFAGLDPARAADGILAADLPAGATVVVTDRRGTVLMAHPAGPGIVIGQALAPGPVRTAAYRMEAGAHEAAEPSGEQRIYAFAPSRIVGGEGFLAAVSIRRDQATSASVAERRNELLALTATLVLAIALAWWLGGRSIVSPARQILETVRQLERGRLDARIPLKGVSHRGEFARIAGAFNLMADSLQLRQGDLETELGRSRSAYAVLDLVLNSMQEGLVAVSGAGQVLMFNEAAALLFPMDDVPAVPGQWPEWFGIYHIDRATLYRPDELPLVRSARGESGRQEQMFVRNARVPEGRLVQCSWQPIHGQEGFSAGLVVFTDVTELGRLQAEQAAQFTQLRDTQRKLVEAQRLGGIGNWEMNLESGRLWWSDELYELFGVARADFDGTLNAFVARVHPQDRHLLKPARDSALRDGKVMNVEYRVIKPDGTLAWMHEIAEARRNEQDEPVWFGGVVQDITDRKLAEHALLASERELQDYTSMLQRAAEAAQAIMAHPTLLATLQEVADQARRVIGTVRAAVSLSATATDPPMRAVSGREGRDSASRAPMAVPLVSRNGRHIGLLEVSGKRAGEFSRRDEYVALELAQLASTAIENAWLFAQVRELNAGLEARIAERTAELTRQEQLFRTLAEQAPEVVWNTDATGTHLTFLNRAWYELVGGTPADWIGKSGLGAVHPDDRAEVSANWRRCGQTLNTFSGVRRLRAKDGSYHTTSYKGAPVLDEQGAVAFWVGIDADITEFKAIEHALRDSNQELQAFSYSVSHDLRAPLGAIAGFSRALALKLEGQGDDRVRHYLARIQAGVEKMEELIEAMLSLAQVARAPLNYGPVDLSALAVEALEGMLAQQPGRDVVVQVEEGLVAQGDARLLRVVLENLLGNAWKFTSQLPKAHIDVGRLPDSGVFFVRDNGVGFEMAYAYKLFGAFQRLHTEAEFPGTGIGLATVRRIIARHQGRVWAESQVGQGTTFYFTLSEAAPPAWLGAEGAG